MAEIVADIANASNEQATGIEQVNKALTQMDEVTQQNSALVEENAATAKTLEHQAKAMDERVSFFKLNAVAADRPVVEAVGGREHRSIAAPSRGLAAAVKQQPAAAPKRAAAEQCRRTAPPYADRTRHRGQPRAGLERVLSGGLA